MLLNFVNYLFDFVITHQQQNLEGLNKISDKLEFDLKSIIPASFSILSASYKELLDMEVAAIPGALFVEANNQSIFSYSSFWYHLHILFSYYSFSNYPLYYRQMFNSLTRITNDLYYIVAIKNNNIYTAVNIYRNQALYQRNIVNSINQYYISYSGLLFYAFPSLILNHDYTKDSLKQIADRYDKYGLHAYVVSNQLTGIVMDVMNIDNPMLDYVDPVYNLYYNAFAFFTPNNFYVFSNGMKALDQANTEYQVIKLENNHNNQINILPDGSVIKSFTIQTLYTSYNELMYYYLLKNQHRWTIFNTMHLYGNFGINIYDQLATENFTIEKSDIIHLSTTTFPQYTVPDYIYQCNVKLFAPQNVIRYYVPLFTNESRYDSYAFIVHQPTISRSDINNNILVVLSKYTSIYNASTIESLTQSKTLYNYIIENISLSNYSLATFHTYLYSQSNDSFRVIYEYDVPPLVKLTYVYSNTLDYKFDFTKVKVGGPVIIRIGQNKYLVYVLQPIGFNFVSISGEFYRYNYISHSLLTNLNVFAIEYTNDALFYDPYKSITITYSKSNCSLIYEFTFKAFTELHLNVYSMYNNILQMYVYNELQLPQQTTFSCLTSKTNKFSSDIFNVQISSITDANLLNDYFGQLYNLLNAAVTSITSTNSLDNTMQLYNIYARQYICQLLLRNYDEYEFIYYSQTRKSLFTLYLNANKLPSIFTDSETLTNLVSNLLLSYT